MHADKSNFNRHRGLGFRVTALSTRQNGLDLRTTSLRLRLTVLYRNSANGLQLLYHLRLLVQQQLHLDVWRDNPRPS